MVTEPRRDGATEGQACCQVDGVIDVSDADVGQNEARHAGEIEAHPPGGVAHLQQHEGALQSVKLPATRPACPEA
jgi:hypothetical protein